MSDRKESSGQVEAGSPETPEVKGSFDELTVVAQEVDVGDDPEGTIVEKKGSTEESGQEVLKKVKEAAWKKKERDLIALQKKSVLWAKIFVILGGLLLGIIAAPVTYLLFPAAIASVATLLGLTGPLALVIPLVAVGTIGALFGMEFLAFLEERFLSIYRLNHRFMFNLVIACGLIAGIALGVFLVASTPAVASLLSFATAVPGASGVVLPYLPYIIGATATLFVTGLIGYVLYRASGMQKEQIRRVKEKELLSPKDKSEETLIGELGIEGGAKKDLEGTYEPLKGEEDEKAEAPTEDPHAVSYDGHPITGPADKSKNLGKGSAPAPEPDKPQDLRGSHGPSQGGGDGEHV